MRASPSKAELDALLPDYQDLYSLVEARARDFGASTFMVWQPFDQPAVTYTYSAILHQARSFAAGLQARGVRCGDRILVHLENCPEFIIAWLGCAAAGVVAVTTNTRSAGDELAYYADDSGVVGTITQPKYFELLSIAAPKVEWRVCTDNDSGVKSELPVHSSGFASMLISEERYIRPRSAPLDALIVQYTSGTTARPKGVVWTNANALWAARINANHQVLEPTDCYYTYLPLFHANAMTFSVLPTLWAGGSIVLTPKWSTSRFWDYSIKHKCTFTSLIGLSIRALMSSPVPRGHSYRMFGSGICADQFPNVGTKTIGWWGMTETVAPGIVGSAKESNRFGAIGKPAPQYEISILRSDGTPAGAEETGDLFIRGIPGLTLFGGYLNKPEITANSYTHDGWFKTGDLVTLHADGFITFADRGKDMLRVGAENVAASEVERVIAAVPGVIEAAVVGRPDDKLDEVPVAFVVGRSTDDALPQKIRAACQSMLADFKVPREIYLVRSLPRSTISKVNKVELRAVALPGADRASAEQKWAVAAVVDPSGDAD